METNKQLQPRYLRYGPLVVVASAILICMVINFFRQPFTPEEAARRPSQSPAFGDSFRILGTRSAQNEVIVIYRQLLPPDGMPTVGCYLVVKQGLSWAIESGSSFDGNQRGPFILYGLGQSPQRNEQLLCGQVLSPPVAMIEVQLANGQTVQDDSRDGVFAITVSNDVKLRSVQALDDHNQTLQQIDMAK